MDFSDTSRRAVEAAAAYFPGQTITLLHSYKAPRASVAEDRINYTEQMRQAALHDLAAFLDSVNLTEDQRKYFGVMVEVGDEAKLLKDLVRLSDIELVVLGLRKRGLLVRALIGGSEKSVITANLCDVLVVR